MHTYTQSVSQSVDRERETERQREREREREREISAVSSAGLCNKLMAMYHSKSLSMYAKGTNVWNIGVDWVQCWALHMRVDWVQCWALNMGGGLGAVLGFAKH